MKMVRMNWIDIRKNVLGVFKEKSSEILTGIGIGSGITAIIFAVTATPEAVRRIERKKEEDHHKKLTALQVVQSTWKCYIPAAVAETISVSCLIGACTINKRKNAALATAASIADASLREYRQKVIETIGDKKESTILDSIDRDRVEKNPPPQNTNEIMMVDGSSGQTLCYDSLFGRYFYSDVDSIKRAVNRLNRDMATMSEPYISLNEFYMEIGMPTVDMGDRLGWNVNDGLIDLHFSSQLVNGRTPCLVISHVIPPKYDYYK